MSKPTRLSHAEYRSLLAAGRVLITDVGGVEAAAAACRLSKTSLARHYSPHHQECLPVDVVAELESVAGSAPVTHALARLAGHTLVPMGAEPGEPELLRRLGELMRRTGAACASGAEAMADSVLTRDERSELSVLLHQVVTEGSSLMAWLAHPSHDDAEGDA